jgi:hypothetical protein
VVVKPNAQNVMLDEPAFKTRMAASIAEIADDSVDRDRWHRRERRLKPIDSRQRQHPRKDRPRANQHHEQFEKIC